MIASTRQVEPLTKRHDRSTFACGNEALDRYLQHQARQDAERHVAAPFVLLVPPHAQVLGYYTLSASTVRIDELPQEQARRLPRYPLLPVTLLGRLAVDRSLKGQGAGTFLLMDALHRCAASAAQIAAMAVVVDAKDETAATFYRHFDFMPLQSDPHRLFLPMKTVAAVFGG